MQRRKAAIAGAVAGIVGLGAALVSYGATTYQVSNVWALYASHNEAGPYQVFIDPFPNRRSCDIERRIIVGAGGHAQCREHPQILKRSRYLDLAWEFFSPGAPGLRLCGKIQ